MTTSEFARSMASRQVLCPVDREQQQWIDRRWAWLEGQFGARRACEATVILPRAEFFPDAFSHAAEDVQAIFDRMCKYMRIDRQSVQLYLYTDDNPVHEGRWQQRTGGLYREDSGIHEIWLEGDNLRDPLALVATLAHELSHVHLLGHGRITNEAEDHEPLTDLLTVFLGLGVFTANSVIREHYWNSGHHSGWSIGRSGYLSMPDYGYALARFARQRGEVTPEWVNLLRPDVRAAYHQACRFLDAPEHERGYPVKASPHITEDDQGSAAEQEADYEEEDGTRADEADAEPFDEDAFGEEEADEDDGEMRYEVRAKRAEKLGQIVSGLFATCFFAFLGMIVGALMGEMLKSAFGLERAGDIGAILGAITLGLYALRVVLRRKD